MAGTAEYFFARVSDADAEAAANELVCPPIDSPTSRAYSVGRVQLESLVDWAAPHQCDRRRVVARGRAIGGVR